MSEKEKDLTTGEIREGLATALKEKLTKFEKNLEQLSKKEESAQKALEPLKKTTPPGVSEELMHKLKREYGGDKEKAYATAWKIHNEQKSKRLNKNAVEGYGASSAMSGSGVPGLQQTGVGMNKNAMCDYSKAEACSKCGKTHKETMGKCSTDEIKPEVPMDKAVIGSTHALRAAGVPSTPKPTMPKAPNATAKAEGVAGYPLKGQSKKSEDYINRKDSANPKARTKTIGKEGTLPGTKASKKVEAEGSGGQIKENKGLSKSDSLAKQMSTEGPITMSTKGKTPVIPGKGRSAAGIRGATPRIPGRSTAGIRGAVPSLKPHQSTITSLQDIRAMGNAKAALGTAPTLPAVPAAGAVPAMPAFERKIGADEILAARAAGNPTPKVMPAQAPIGDTTMKIPGRPAANELAADKRAGGVGFLNSLISKFRGTGNANWQQVATAPSKAKTGSRLAAGMGALARSEMTKADKPEVGRKPTVSEKAFGNKTAMTAPDTAPHPGEPAKSMYKADTIPGQPQPKPHPYQAHLNWMTEAADPENGADRLAHATVKAALINGQKPSAHAVAHTLNWLSAKSGHASAMTPEAQKKIKELHGAVSRLGGVKAPPGQAKAPLTPLKQE